MKKKRYSEQFKNRHGHATNSEKDDDPSFPRQSCSSAAAEFAWGFRRGWRWCGFWFGVDVGVVIHLFVVAEAAVAVADGRFDPGPTLG